MIGHFYYYSTTDKVQPHVTIMHDTVDLTIQGVPSRPLYRYPPLLTPGGHHRRPVQTCSHEDSEDSKAGSNYLAQ